MKKIKIVLLLLLLSATISCKESSTETKPKELLNTLWILESFEVDRVIIVPPANQIYNIQFFADSTLNGQSDCNRIGGKYSLGSNNSIKIIEFGTTEVGCGDKSKGEEYFTAISVINSYHINSDKLNLYYKENSRITFIKNK